MQPDSRRILGILFVGQANFRALLHRYSIKRNIRNLDFSILDYSLQRIRNFHRVECS